DGIEVPGRNVMVSAHRGSELRMQARRIGGIEFDDLSPRAGLGLEVVQPGDIRDDACETSREHRVGEVRIMRLTVDDQAMDTGAKGFLNLSGCSREGNEVRGAGRFGHS